MNRRIAKKKHLTKIKEHKYLRDLGLKEDDLPWKWDVDYKKRLENQEKIYGFNMTETYSLDLTLDLFLYERLMMYREKAKEVIDFTSHKYEYEGKTKNLGELLDLMIDGLRFRLTKDKFDSFAWDEKDLKQYNEPYQILAIIINDLWW